MGGFFLYFKNLMKVQDFPYFSLDINLTFSYTIQVPVTQQNTWRGVRAAEGA